MRATFAVILALTLVASVVLSLWRQAKVVADADLDAAAAYVRGDHADGDLIVVEPAYIVGVRRRLGDLPLWEPRHLVARDLVGFSRVHLVEIDTIGFDGVLAGPLSRFAAQESTQSFGAVRVATFLLPEQGRVVFDLRDEIKNIQVIARYPDGVELPCDRIDRGRRVCPRDSEWSYIGPRTVDIDNQPRECVWMHPIGAGGTLRIETPQIVGLGTIHAAFGFTREASGRAAAPVTVRLLSGDKQLGSRTIPVELGWQRMVAELGGDSGVVAIELETQNNGAAHFCGSLLVVAQGSGP